VYDSAVARRVIEARLARMERNVEHGNRVTEVSTIAIFVRPAVIDGVDAIGIRGLSCRRRGYRMEIRVYE